MKVFANLAFFENLLTALQWDWKTTRVLWHPWGRTCSAMGVQPGPEVCRCRLAGVPVEDHRMRAPGHIHLRGLLGHLFHVDAVLCYAVRGGGDEADCTLRPYIHNGPLLVRLGDRVVQNAMEIATHGGWFTSVPAKKKKERKKQA